MDHKLASRKTLERNLRTGRWVATSQYDPARATCLVRITKSNKTRPAGRLVCISVMLEKPDCGWRSPIPESR